jgi:hypothetical protein
MNQLAQLIHSQYGGDLNELGDMAAHAYKFLSALDYTDEIPNTQDHLASIVQKDELFLPGLVSNGVYGWHECSLDAHMVPYSTRSAKPSPQ